MSEWQKLPAAAPGTALEVVKAGGQSLSTLNRGATTPENSIQVFEVIILQLLEWLGVEWSEMQIRETAELMSAEYHWMTLAEIKAFTAKVKIGQYGKEWGKFRPMLLMGWMREWSIDVLIARETYIGMAKPQPLPEIKGAVYVEPEKVFGAIKEVFGANVDDAGAQMSTAQKEEIYRQEKIKERQRDIMRNNENTEI